jgi:hypothetical protein
MLQAQEVNDVVCLRQANERMLYDVRRMKEQAHNDGSPCQAYARAYWLPILFSASSAFGNRGSFESMHPLSPLSEAIGWRTAVSIKIYDYSADSWYQKASKRHRQRQ